MAGLKPIGQSLRELTGSSQSSAVSTHRLTDPETAVERAKLLAGCYRKDDAADPEVYAGAIAAVLAEYPPDIVQQVTDPRSGLPSRLQWLPSVKEVRDECESIDARRRRLAEMAAREEQQLRERREFEASQARKPSYEQLKAKYGDNWGLRSAAPENDQARVKRTALMRDANRASFVAECKSAGVPEDSVVSPSLAAIIRGNTPARAAE